MATYLSRAAAGFLLDPASRDELTNDAYLPEECDAWVLGQASWDPHAHGLVRDISGGIRESSYRIVLLGFDPGVAVESERPVFYDESARLRAAGMVRKNVHNSPDAFRRACIPLLEQMQDHVRRTNQPPTPVIARLGIPFCYAGG